MIADRRGPEVGLQSPGWGETIALSRPGYSGLDFCGSMPLQFNPFGATFIDGTANKNWPRIGEVQRAASWTSLVLSGLLIAAGCGEIRSGEPFPGGRLDSSHAGIQRDSNSDTLESGVVESNPAAAMARPPLTAWQPAQEETAETALYSEAGPSFVDLGPGDLAPPLQIETMIRGDRPAPLCQSGKVRVVLFWATWCRYSLASMPQMRDAQVRYPDVEFVALSDEEPRRITTLLNRRSHTGQPWHNVMTFAVAKDRDNRTAAAYLDASGTVTLPAAFIVDRQGRLAWTGSPKEMDKPLAQVVEGTHDLREEARVFQSRRAVRQAAFRRDTEGVLALLEELEAAVTMPESFQLMQLDLLSEDKRYEDFNRVGRRLVAQDPGNAELMNYLAWEIVDTQTGDRRDLDLAMDAARLANQATGQREGYIVDTLARVFYEQGDLGEALRLQRIAVKLRPYSTPIQRALDRYEVEINRSPAQDNNQPEESE